MPKKKKRWIITVGGKRSIREVAKDVAAAGLESRKILEEVGSITGSATDAVIAKVREIPGVVEASPDTDIDVGPPDDPDTW